MKMRRKHFWRGRWACICAALAVLSGPVGCGSSDDEMSDQEIGLEEGEFEDGEPLNNVEEVEITQNDFLDEANAGGENFNNFENLNGEENGNFENNLGDENFNNFENLNGEENGNFENNLGDENFNNFENNLGDENFNNFENNLGDSDFVNDGNGLNNFLNDEFSEGDAGTEVNALLDNGAGDAFNPVAEDPSLNGGLGEDPFAAGATADLNGEAADPFAADAGADPFAAFAGEDPFAADAAGDLADPVLADAGTFAAGGEGSVAVPSQGMVPEDGARLAYMIQVGDTLAIISQKIFGNSGRWRTLAQENNLANPNLIYAGDVIFYTLDGSSRGFAERYEAAPRETVTVQSGDTLSGIAQRVFGTQAAWRTLWKENPQITNPDVIEVGTVLNYRAPNRVAHLHTPSLTEEYLIASLGE